MDFYSSKQKFIEEAKLNVRPFDEDLISRSWDFAKDAHSDQLRNTGETYFSHPVGVAQNLFAVKCDSVTIAAALLHDVVEDTKISLDDIRDEFGEEVAQLVDGMTKLAPLDKPPEKPWAEDIKRRRNLRKLFVAITNDPRVALVKLADRLHNLTTLGALPKERRLKIASESLDVFAPLAEALGLLVFQLPIQDYAFRQLDPEKYQEVAGKLKEKEAEFKDIRETVVELLEDSLREAKIEADVHGRQKEIYSTYRKMQAMQLEFDRVYDIIGIRVIVNTENDCFLAQRIVDQLGTEVKFDNYIAQPRKPFDYQSLHKIILDKPGGALFEVQIRSKEMDEYNERGPASHWIYKLGGVKLDPAFVKKINILRDRLEAFEENRETAINEIINGLEPQIHVYSPEGDVIALPEGSTPIDFAYHIHTDLGHECYSAHVNGRIVPLEYELSDGDVVGIIRRKGSTPHLSWLRDGKVKSTRAQQKIRHYFHAQKRREMIAEGKSLLQKELKSHKDLHIEAHSLIDAFVQAELLGKLTGEEEFYVALADGRINRERLNRMLGEIIVNRYLEKTRIGKKALPDLVKWFTNVNMIPERREEILFQKVADGVITPKLLNRAIEELANQVLGLTGIAVQKTDPKLPASHLLFHIAQCCYPILGDSIIGFITVGDGLSLHRSNCPQVLIPGRKERLYPIAWEELDLSSSGGMFSGQLILTLVEENSTVYKGLQQVVAKSRGVIREITPIGNSRRPFRLSLKLDVEDVQHLHDTLSKLRQVEGIIDVKRILDDNS